MFPQVACEGWQTGNPGINSIGRGEAVDRSVYQMTPMAELAADLPRLIDQALK
jgi:hypothetical protein